MINSIGFAWIVYNERRMLIKIFFSWSVQCLFDHFVECFEDTIVISRDDTICIRNTIVINWMSDIKQQERTLN